MDESRRDPDMLVTAEELAAYLAVPVMSLYAQRYGQKGATGVPDR